MNAEVVDRLALESQLRKAFAQNEFVIHYQPLVDVASGRIEGVEALLRWNHPERGLLSPKEFMEMAEVTGLVVPIGPWVIESGGARVRAWQELGFPELRLSVNLSARQFLEPDLVTQVERALGRAGLLARHLELEIKESAAMQKAEVTIHTLRQLKTLGIRISIDDFGTGHSSLSYLRRFPLDTLKVDQSFVRDLDRDPGNAAIVTTVIAMSRALGLSVVAEGVEREAQLAFLRERRCDLAQGYLFSRPVGAAEFEALLVTSAAAPRRA